MATSILKRTIHGRGLAVTFSSMKGNAWRRLVRMFPQYQIVWFSLCYFYTINEENVAENVFSSMETHSPGIQRVFIGTNAFFLVRFSFGWIQRVFIWTNTFFLVSFFWLSLLTILKMIDINHLCNIHTLTCIRINHPVRIQLCKFSEIRSLIQ